MLQRKKKVSRTFRTRDVFKCPLFFSYFWQLSYFFFFLTIKVFLVADRMRITGRKLQLSRPQCKLPTFGNASEALWKARSACWRPSVERGAPLFSPCQRLWNRRQNVGNQLLSKRNIFIEPSLKNVALLEDSLCTPTFPPTAVKNSPLFFKNRAQLCCKYRCFYSFLKTFMCQQRCFACLFKDDACCSSEHTVLILVRVRTCTSLFFRRSFFVSKFYAFGLDPLLFLCSSTQ